MSGSVKKVFNLISFVALVFIGVALMLAFIFKDNSLSGPLQLIASILAYIVVIFYAFIYAYNSGSDKKGKWTKRQIIQVCIWAIASILVVLFVFLNF